MDIVYVWMPHPPNVGHASLAIDADQGPGKYEYVSWWPALGRSSKPVLPGAGAAQLSLKDDCEDEEGKYDQHEVLTCLDSQRMREKWRSLKKTGSYSLYFSNCAEMVVQVLVAGGAGLSFDVLTFMGRIKIWAPWDVILLAKTIQQNKAVIEAQRKAGWVPEEPGLLRMWLSTISATGM